MTESNHSKPGNVPSDGLENMGMMERRALNKFSQFSATMPVLMVNQFPSLIQQASASSSVAGESSAEGHPFYRAVVDLNQPLKFLDGWRLVFVLMSMYRDDKALKTIAAAFQKRYCREFNFDYTKCRPKSGEEQKKITKQPGAVHHGAPATESDDQTVNTSHEFVGNLNGGQAAGYDNATAYRKQKDVSNSSQGLAGDDDGSQRTRGAVDDCCDVPAKSRTLMVRTDDVSISVDVQMSDSITVCHVAGRTTVTIDKAS